jgi:hypothetical protein
MGTGDRGRDVSQELTEVRTVLSRAETAIQNLHHMQANHIEFDPRYGGNQGFDPDVDDMLSALNVCVELLNRWRKTGPTQRRV